MHKGFTQPGDWNHAPKAALQRSHGYIHPMGTPLGAERQGFFARAFDVLDRVRRH